MQVIEPEGVYLKIGQIRELQHQVALSPVEGRWKIYILREMERATTEAANALLKTLEEPPSHALLLLTASVLPMPQTPPPPLLKSIWLYAHVIIMLAGYGLLTVACLGAVLYLLQDRMIRAKKLGAWFKRLPPLNRVDSLSQQALVSGFTLLTLGLIAGAAYAQITLGSYLQGDPKEIWSLITWLIYAAFLHCRFMRGWRGKRAAWVAIIGFASVLFTYIGVNFLLSGLHSYA